MRLVDLHPHWAVDADIVIGGVSRHFEGRVGMGITFDCPHCVALGGRVQRLGVYFTNPVDGLPPTDDAQRTWQRTGETFENLSLSPSIDVSQYGHWHGFITSGNVT